MKYYHFNVSRKSSTFKFHWFCTIITNFQLLTALVHQVFILSGASQLKCYSYIAIVHYIPTQIKLLVWLVPWKLCIGQIPLPQPGVPIYTLDQGFWLTLGELPAKRYADEGMVGRMDKEMDDRFRQAGSDVTLQTWRQRMGSEWCFHGGNWILMGKRMAPVSEIQ